MSESEVISRRKALAFVGLVTLFGLTGCATPGSLQRQERRVERRGRRQERRVERRVRRQVRRTGRRVRRQERRTD